MKDNAKVKSVLTIVTHKKVKELIETRSKDDDTGLPEIPSAQFWGNMDQEEKDELMAAVEKAGVKWTTFERNMKAHWPQEKRG